MLQIETRHLEPDIVVLEVTGRIVLGRSCQELEWKAEGLARDGHKKVILDLTGVPHIDSAGIGIIVMSAGRLKQSGGELRLAGSNQHVEQLLRMTNIDKLVSVYPTTSAAGAGF
jgi:anti-anti-sigma factor